MRAPLEALLRPIRCCRGSVAIAHFGRREIFANLVRRPFAGTVYPVNASAREVQGIRAYSSITDLPDAVDLAVVTVPAPRVPAVLQQCATAGTKAAVVITAGFGEAGQPEGCPTSPAPRSPRCVPSDCRPNCLGVLNTDPESLFTPRSRRPGRQRAMCPSLPSRGRWGSPCSMRPATTASEFATSSASATRPTCPRKTYSNTGRAIQGTRVILLYLETIRDPRRLLEAAKRVTRSKPVVAVKSGRGIAGARAAGSHTGALATKDALVDALLSQAGIVRVSTLEELFDAATLLTARQGPVGKRVAIVTNAGGPGLDRGRR